MTEVFTYEDRLRQTMSVGGPIDVVEQNRQAAEAEQLGTMDKIALMGKWSILGESMNAIARKAGMAELDPEYDPDFSVSDAVQENPAFFSEHPYLMDDFTSGRMSFFPNRQHFDYYVSMAEKDYQERAQIDQLGVGAKLLYAMPTQLADVATFSIFAKAAGLGQGAKATYEYAKAGKLLNRMVKLGALGAIENTAQELGIMAVNPDRQTNNAVEVAGAAGSGFLFQGLGGVLVGGAVKGATKVAGKTVKAADHKMGKVFDRMMEIADEKGIDFDGIRAEETKSLDQIARLSKDVADGTLDPVDAGSFAPLRTKRTGRKIDKLVNSANGDLLVNEHPLQAAYDEFGELIDFTEQIGKNMPEQEGPVLGLLKKVIPYEKIEGSVSGVGRFAKRLFVNTPTKYIDSAPVWNTAEGLDWDKAAQKILLHEDLSNFHLHSKGQKYTGINGVEYNLSNKKQFGQAVFDYTIALDEQRRLGTPVPDAPADIQNAARRVQSYFHESFGNAADVGASITAKNEVYVPRMHKQGVYDLRRNAVAQMHEDNAWKWRSMDYETGEQIPVGSHEVNPKSFESLKIEDQQAIIEYVGEGEVITEGALEEYASSSGKEYISQQYYTDLKKQIKAQAEITADRLAGRKDFPETEKNALAIDKSRKLKINMSEFREFYEDDIFTIIEQYDHRVSGNISIRQAIKGGGEELEDMVYKYTGKSLKANQYDPQLLLDATRAEFNSLKEAVEKSKGMGILNEAQADAQIKQLDNEAVRVGRILEHWVDRYMGRSVPPAESVPQALWRLSGRLLGRQTNAAMLGGVTLSQLADLSSLSTFRHLNFKMIRSLYGMIKMAKKMPRKDLELLFVTISDQAENTRFLSFGLDEGLGGRPLYGYGKVAKVAEFLDNATMKLSDWFSTATGMRKWNSKVKEFAASLVMQDTIQAARKFAAVADQLGEGIEKGGQAELEAFSKFNYTADDIARYRRMGIDYEFAEKYLAHLERNGVTPDGKKAWANRIEMYEHIDKDGIIYPELADMHKLDRKLFSRVTEMINGETLNLIPEPKLGSRPVSEKYTLFRLFHQFQSFAFSWSGQLAPVIAQHPSHVRYQYMMMAIGMGALSEAIRNDLRGRRSFDETIQMWKDNPLASLHAAADRGGLYGWLARPIASAEKAGITKMFGIDPIDRSNMAFRNRSVLGLFGPSADVLNKMYVGLTGTPSQLTSVAPMQNLIWFDLMHRATEKLGVDNPFGPGVGVDPLIMLRSKSRQEEAEREE